VSKENLLVLEVRVNPTNGSIKLIVLHAYPKKLGGWRRHSRLTAVRKLFGM